MNFLIKMEIVIKEEKQKWYQSRRVWAAGLTFIASIAVTVAPEQYDVIIQICMLIASLLGITSWIAPTK